MCDVCLFVQREPSLKKCLTVEQYVGRGGVFIPQFKRSSRSSAAHLLKRCRKDKPHIASVIIRSQSFRENPTSVLIMIARKVQIRTSRRRRKNDATNNFARRARQHASHFIGSQIFHSIALHSNVFSYYCCAFLQIAFLVATTFKVYLFIP